MKVLILFAVIIPALAHPSSGHEPRCLTEHKSKEIAENWLDLWRGKFDGLNHILSPKFVYYMEDKTFSSKPLVDEREEMKDFIYNDSHNATTLDSVVTSWLLLYQFHSCDKIAVKWKYVGRTTGLHEKETGVPAGKTISAKGVDLLFIDLHSGKVKEAQTHQDSLYYLDQAGYSPQPTPKS